MLSNHKGRRRLDLAAALLVILTLSVAVLYPENFISGVSYFSSGLMDPLFVLMPFLAVFGAAYAISAQRVFRIGWLDGAVLLYFLYMLARNLTTVSAAKSVKYVIVGATVFYLTSLLTARRPQLLRLIVAAVVCLILATAVYGLAEYATQSNFIYGQYISVFVEEPVSGLHRIGSSLAHPVPYGAFLLQALPFAVLFWIISRSRFQRGLALAATVLGVLALFFTYSKGSWIVAIIVAGGALLSARRTPSKKIILPFMLIAAVIAITTAVFWQDIQEEIEGRTFSSVTVRMHAWRAAYAGIKANPVIGVGLRQGSAEISKYVDQDWYETWARPLPVDNFYLNLLFEAGVIGFLLWSGILILIFREGIGLARIRGPSLPWVGAALASIVAICLNAVTFEAMHIWPNYILFWIAAGILHGLSMSSIRGTKMVCPL